MYRIFLKVIRIISYRLICVLPAARFKAVFLIVTPLIRHPELVSGSQKGVHKKQTYQPSFLERKKT